MKINQIISEFGLPTAGLEQLRVKSIMPAAGNVPGKVTMATPGGVEVTAPDTAFAADPNNPNQKTLDLTKVAGTPGQPATTPAPTAPGATPAPATPGAANTAPTPGTPGQAPTDIKPNDTVKAMTEEPGSVSTDEIAMLKHLVAKLSK